MPSTAVASPVAGKRSCQRVTVMSTLLLFIVLGALVPLFAPLPSISSRFISSPDSVKSDDWRFEIADDKFWKDGEPFRIIGGDVHYFRIHPQYWEDRLLRAKSLGLNTIQTYVPWNLHERRQGEFVFEGFADIVSFLKLCQKLDLLVMLRPGPYICAEWDLGGFPAWILSIEPALRLRSSDPVYIDLVGKWWKILLPKLSSLLYINGGPIIMVQIENEFGSYGDDKTYLHHLVKLAHEHLGDGVIFYSRNFAYHVEHWRKSRVQAMETLLWKFKATLCTVGLHGPPLSGTLNSIFPCTQCLFFRFLFFNQIMAGCRYTTDGGTRETLGKGTISGDKVFSAVDFTTGDDPWPIFNLQKKFNMPGKSPPLSAEFYTGWLTHWGEKIATTEASFTADFLEKILSRNGSVVLYMAHGGTNFGFYNGANTGADESDYKADLTSYDYDAPIRESGDVGNAKYKALRSVISRYSPVPLASVPKNNEIAKYGNIKLKRSAYLFDIIGDQELVSLVVSETPVSMESLGQMFGFVLYASEYIGKGNGSILSIPKVHDRAQVFLSCYSDSEGEKGRPLLVGTIVRWSNNPIKLPDIKCPSRIVLYILVENMGRINYGKHNFDRKGILSSVNLDGKHLYKWKMFSIPLHNLNDGQKITSTISHTYLKFRNASSRRSLKDTLEGGSEPAFYIGHFDVDTISDTYISMSGWSKGLVFVNDFNIGRYWPSFGPQCNLYVPAPIIRDGENVVVILELEYANAELSVSSVDKSDFKCKRI